MLDTNIVPYYSGFLRFCISTEPQETDCIGLIVAQKQAAGTATANVPVRVYTPKDAAKLFGPNSIAAKMAQIYFCACGGTLGRGALYVLPVADDAGGVAPVYTLTITGTATESQRLYCELPTGYQSGQTRDDANANALYSVFVNNGDTAATVATALAAAINADGSKFFSASASLGVITLTAAHKGTALNNVVPEFFPMFGTSIPDGLTLAWAQTVVGSGDPSIVTALGNIGECCYDCFALGFASETAIDLLTQEIRNRWECGSAEQCLGHLFHYKQDTASNIETYGLADNDAERTIIPMPATYKFPGAFLAAAWAGRVCCVACDEPGRPIVRDNGILSCLHDYKLCGTGPFTATQREAFAQAGVAVWGYGRDGQLYIDTNITNYKYNVHGDPDKTWRQTESRYLVKALKTILSDFYNAFYSSTRLVDNGTPLPIGRPTTAPAAFKAHLIGYLEGQDDSFAGVLGSLIDDDALGDNILVERDTHGRPNGTGDADRLNVMFKATLIGQLLRIATRIVVKTK